MRVCMPHFASVHQRGVQAVELFEQNRRCTMKIEEKATAIGRAQRFMRRELWALRTDELPWFKRAGVHALRLGCLVVNGFRGNQCSLHAASLTFFSMMALVPIAV